MANSTESYFLSSTLSYDVSKTPVDNNTDDILDMAKRMHWVTSVIIGTLFVCPGLVGNSLSMYIWSRKSMRSSTGTYLIAQALADSGLLIFFYLVDVISMINPDIKKNYVYAVFFSYIGYPIFFFFVVSSIWLTVGVTVDRYIQVCWITKAKVRPAIIYLFLLFYLIFL